MSVETGYELLDAIINNPMQSVILFISTYVAYKFFFSCRGFFAELRHNIKFEIKHELRWQSRKVERWFERTDKKYQEWITPKKGVVIYLSFMSFILSLLGLNLFIFMPIDPIEKPLSFGMILGIIIFCLIMMGLSIPKMIRSVQHSNVKVNDN